MPNKQKSRGQPYVQKIRLGNDNKRIRRKSPKHCPDCKETSGCVKLMSDKLSRIEEAVHNFDRNVSGKNNSQHSQYSKFNAKFTLNNIPCELEHDLSNFSFENLQKLLIITTQICNINN